MEKVRDYFLFAIYTGLRYSDIEQLQWNNINLNSNILSLQMNKTGEELNIPIIAPAKALLLKYLPKTIEKGTESVFPVLANQPTNRYLKELISLAKIDKRISFHCARHTFATLHIQAGTHLLNLRDLLGHKDVSVTQVYAKTLKQGLINSMNSFSGLLEDTYPAPSLLKKIS